MQTQELLYNVGRPKKYDKAFCDTAARLLYKWMDESPDNIFIEEFCYNNKINDKAIQQCCRESELFSEAVEALKTKQKIKLYKHGLDKTYSHPMCTLILGHNHGIYLKTEQKLTGDNSNPLSFVVGIATEQKSKELIEAESDELHERAIDYSEREAQQSMVAAEQSLLYSGQERPQDTVQT